MPDDKALDLALLAFVNAPKEPATVKQWDKKYGVRGKSLLIVKDPGGMPQPATRFPTGDREGDDEKVMVSVPGTNDLLEKSGLVNSGHFAAPKFKHALNKKYGLRTGQYEVITLMAQGQSNEPDYKPPETIIVLHKHDLKSLAQQALEKLADPKKVEKLLGIGRADYKGQLKASDSTLSKMIAAIVENGGFGKKSESLVRIVRDASKHGKGNYEFAARLRDFTNEMPDVPDESFVARITGVEGMKNLPRSGEGFFSGGGRG